MSDTTLLGVLRMPFDLAMATPTARIQYHQRGVQAAAEIEQRTRERDEARAEVERLRAALRDIERGDYSDPMCQRTPEQRAREALEGKQ